MTISSTNTKNSYSGDGSTVAFSYTFKILDDDDIQVILRTNATGAETVQTKTTHYTVSGVGNAGGGTITFVSAPAATETVVLLRNTPLTQATDYTPNDPFPAAAHEDALDKLTFLAQEIQEELDRSIKVSKTNTITSPEFTVGATDRANRIFAFDSNGDLSVTQEIGTYQGTDTTTTTSAYSERDIIKSTTAGQLNNVYICVADSVAGDLLTDTDHFELLVDAVSAATSATAAASSATAAASSATAAAASESAAATSETNAATSASNASTSETNAATSATNAATSATNAATSETNAGTSATAAASSATAAAASATAAAASESAAATSETNAATSASNASTSETNAATSASSASTSATNAATSETNAATSASNASTSETNAATSASAAAASQTAAAASAASAASAYDSFDDRYLGVKASDPTVDNDGDPLSAGLLYFSSSENIMKVYDGASWIAATSAGNVSLILYEYTATSGQTTFSGADDNAATLSYTVNNIQVVMNGVILDPSDYTATNGTSVVLASGAAANDLINIYAFKSFTVADTVSASAGGTFSANVSFADNAKAIFGAGSDLQIYHDGNNSLINDLGTGDLRLRSNGSGVIVEMSNGNDLAQFLNGSGEAKLMHNGSEKLATTSTGIDVTGAITTDAITETSGGNVGIGQTNPDSESLLDLGSGENSGYTRKLLVTNTGNSRAGLGALSNIFRVFYADDQAVQFGTLSRDGNFTFSEKMRLDSSGRLLINRTSASGVNPYSKLHVLADSAVSAATIQIGTNGYAGISFLNAAGSDVGSIVINASSTAYNTSSDYRLKENVADMTGAIDRVKALAPKRFNFIADADTTVDGFLAHEAQAVVPEAVTGTHNEVDEDGNPVMQGIDQSKLVPLLTGALREAIAKIETLETQRADLEARLTALENAS